MPQTRSCPLYLGPASSYSAFLLKKGPRKLLPHIVCATFAPGASASNPDSGVKLTAAGMERCTISMPSTNIAIV